MTVISVFVASPYYELLLIYYILHNIFTNLRPRSINLTYTSVVSNRSDLCCHIKIVPIE